MITPLISVAELATFRPGENCVIVDCRFALGHTEAGRDAFLEAHIPGAVYAHLDDDLSGPATTDAGRHPLPPPARLCAVFGELGITRGVTVIAYDDSFGMVASRLWWMLRYMGHHEVAVLDGGWQAWVNRGLPVSSGSACNPPRHFSGQPHSGRLVQLADVASCSFLLDARDPARYRGEIEPIDPRPGHIPGARNHCWQDNLAADGTLRPPAELRDSLSVAGGRLPDSETTHYCGSGVSACHNILAQVVAGLPEPRLYCGSWSEWCRDPSRQVMIGPEPD